MAEDLLTVPEVAELLKLKEGTIRTWLRDGKLPGFILGSRQAGWRVRRSDIDRFIEETRQGKAKAA
jgi:excisionase family DNA binding protein